MYERLEIRPVEMETSMTEKSVLAPAAELADLTKFRFPNESDEYRSARNRLLAEEIELRRHIERVALMRRSLPAGGLLSENYQFEGKNGAIELSELFGDKDTLIVYSMMFGPQRERPCPMCTALLTSWDGTARNLREKVAVAITARSPFEKLSTFRRERGFRNLDVYSDGDGAYTRAYVSPEDSDIAGLTVFTRQDQVIRHSWSMEMNDEMADPGQDQRGAPDPDPLWTILDLTPRGRGATWYPQLEYEGENLVSIK
jgi:predicted dithiol-disulfide oxidoreductase (DUF899 family)